jgi:uncharacterized protein (TIGR03067 family)
MRKIWVGWLVLGICISASSAGDDVITKDRKQIEGTWQVTAMVVNGNPVPDDDARKFTVLNRSDGTWALLADGKEISRGTSSFEPMNKPKTLEFMPSQGVGSGNTYQGIYELAKNTRKMCFAPADRERPTEFASMPGSDHILMTFERVKK